MKGRFYFRDGRIAEDVMLDDRATRFALPDGERIRWFIPTGRIEPDGFAELREVVAPAPQAE